jgi:hypothetical protein
MSVKMTDNSPQVKARIEKAADELLGALAVDILRASKMVVPVKTGILQNTGAMKRVSPLKWEVSYGKASNAGANAVKYALYQHSGQRVDGTHKVLNYTTPGTNKGYLLGPAEKVVRAARSKIKSVMGRI